jgi:hypothetical protein
MYFLLNDEVFHLNGEELVDSEFIRRFGAIDFDFVHTVGQELFSEQPLLHRTHPERAKKLCALIHLKAPSINGALFVAPSAGCKPKDVGVRFASLQIEVMAGLQRRHVDGDLTTAVVDREVWRRLAA